MRKNKFKLNIGSILEAEEGAHVEFDIDASLKLDDKNEIPLTAAVQVMKLQHEVNVTAKKFTAETSVICSRCIKKFKQKISIKLIERQFLFERPRVVEDADDLYLVDMKNATIDIAELFRQELLLHFPLIPLCSLKCKGLCAVCGKNLNLGDCGHNHDVDISSIETQKPLLKLKELFKQSQNGKTTDKQTKSSTKPNQKKI
ncbi:MAG: hypothetical protein US89_C0005G0060 [Candidatus Peregrinibacteria bacterium GW2011_GWF2_38_29]|nr:MAG: hypothetical protein US89_C0005G0060 [Candidatus Peregrinibacteria bacterium GW2011_GWF2_38_29]